MRRLVLASLVVIAGCQNTTLAPQGASSPSRTSASTSSAAPRATASTSPLVVVTNAVDQSRYTVSLVGLDGKMVAQASAAPGDKDPVPFPGSAAAGSPSGMADPRVRLVSYAPSLPNAGVCCDAFLPALSMSSSRVYFPDGLTTVRFLGPDGSTGTASSLPNLAGRARAIFAVSPDDQRIAVSVFDWSTRPMKMRIYVEDLTGGGHHVEIFASTSLYEWPVGWHDGRLVLAGGPALGGAPNPYAASSYHLVNASTGDRIAVLAGNDCPAVGPLSTAGTACVSSAGNGLQVASQCHCIEAVDWSGARRPTYVYNDPGEFNWAALSPNGHAVIFSEIYGSRTGGGIWQDGTVTWMKGYEEAGARAQWLDDQHTLVSTCLGGGVQCIGIQTLANQVVVPVVVAGLLVGTLPGGL